MRFIDIFAPIYHRLPEVKTPEVQPPLKRKLIWTGLALVLFFIMGQISIIGLDSFAAGQLGQLQQILASNIGTIITAGIGPIVLASIILQLLVGGKIIDLDLSNPADKAKFSGMQKLFAIILSFFEAIIYTMSGFLSPAPGMFIPVMLQVALGSIILLYLDEVVSKYGIGSGIGLFIAGGVSQEILWRFFAPPIASVPGGGNLWQFITSFATGINFLILVPALFTILIFLVVVYAEGIHVNIPITMGRKGTGGRFPVKFLYVSNLPVILTVALFANIQIISKIVPSIPAIGQYIAIATNPVAHFVTSPASSTINPGGSLLNYVVFQISSEGFVNAWSILAPNLLHAFIYAIIFISFCVIFGKFWVELGGQGPAQVSEQLQKSGMSIPGFRRDPRIIRKILDRYIPPITIMGSIFVALLAVLADLTGALGSGTGILLTVGIVYRLYEELAKEQLMESNILMKKLMGG
ncbi:MAG: preprotein translocase subunit SecY [archaeon]|nr:preprotein translocase subunit SecY [archaeon]